MIKEFAENLSEVLRKKIKWRKIIFGNLFGTKMGDYPLFFLC